MTSPYGREYFAAVYDILVEHAGANPEKKGTFVWYLDSGATEWLFKGLLGSGGKFYRVMATVSCYPEQENPERIRIINKVNALLWENLTLFYGPNPWNLTPWP